MPGPGGKAIKLCKSDWKNGKTGALAVRKTYKALTAQAAFNFHVAVAEDGNLPEHPRVTNFDRILDVTFRHKAFQIAMRYWEGRWIIESQKLQDAPPDDKIHGLGREGTEARFRRLVHANALSGKHAP